MNKIVFSLFLLLFLLGCEPESFDAISTVSQPKAHAVLLSNLQQGQVSRYLSYELDCDSGEQSFRWTGDTLILSVVQEGESLFLEEILTDGSKSLENSDNWLSRYPVRYHEGKLIIPDRSLSRLFFFYGNDELDLVHTIRNKPKLNQAGCRLMLESEPFIGNEIAQVQKFELGEILQRNRTVVSCVPIQIELEAYLMYDNQQLYLSHTYDHYTFWDQVFKEVSGWQLME